MQFSITHSKRITGFVFLAMVQATFVHAEGLSLISIKTNLGHLRAALAWAVRQKVLAEVPHIRNAQAGKGLPHGEGQIALLAVLAIHNAP